MKKTIFNDQACVSIHILPDDIDEIPRSSNEVTEFMRASNIQLLADLNGTEEW